MNETKEQSLLVRGIRIIERFLVPEVAKNHISWRKSQDASPLGLIDFATLRLNLFATQSPLSKIENSDLLHPVTIRVDTSDEYVYEQVFVNEEYCIEYPKPTTIVDAGANIGLATVLFASRHPKARIIAIEPDPNSFAVLQRNAAPYANVTCLQAGLWHRPANLVRIPDEAKPWAYRYMESDSPDGIESVSLDEIANRFDSGTIDLLKVDIEGAEKDVFTAGGDWLSSVQTVIAESHDRFMPGSTAAIRGRFPTESFSESMRGENHVFIRRAENVRPEADRG